MGQVLGIVYRVIATHLIKKAGYTRTTAHTGAVTWIQRLGSALNLNLHFHRLFLDAVYVDRADGAMGFQWVREPLRAELRRRAHSIAHRVGRTLERQGRLERDAERRARSGEAVDAEPMAQLLGHAITDRIAVGPHAGRQVFTRQTRPAGAADEPRGDTAGQGAGFSLPAGVAARADERQTLATPCRYLSRPAVSEQRLSLTATSNVRYPLKTPYRDGTTHVMLLRASCPSPSGPAFGSSKSLPAILSSPWTLAPGSPPWSPSHGSSSRGSTLSSPPIASTERK